MITILFLTYKHIIMGRGEGASSILKLAKLYWDQVDKMLSLARLQFYFYTNRKNVQKIAYFYSYNFFQLKYKKKLKINTLFHSYTTITPSFIIKIGKLVMNNQMWSNPSNFLKGLEQYCGNWIIITECIKCSAMQLNRLPNCSLDISGKS